MIDRIAPTIRPSGPAAGYQQWRSLLFMHWPVPVVELRALVPREMEIDSYDDVAYVGLVPFAMQAVRPRWAPQTLGFTFLETNVRTYVTYRGRPGVYFFSLDAASRIAVWVARTVWSLPYYFAAMEMEQRDNTLHYHSNRRGSGRELQVSCQLGEQLAPSEPGSLEFFFLERYLLFLKHKQQIYTGQVYHTPYPAQLATVLELDDQLCRAAGIESCEGMPAFTHFSPGVNVEIFNLRAE